MSIPQVINPWMKGFQPPSKCPFCMRVNSLVFTGTRTQGGDHVYKCQVCNKMIGAPTQYAQCKLFDTSIEKDVFHTPCINCPNRTIASHHGVCIHWRNLEWTDLPIADAIAETIRRFDFAS